MMDINQIDEETEQRLMDISQEDDFEEHIAMLVRNLHNKKKEGLTDEEAELLSYMIINKLSNEMANYLVGFVEIDD